MVTVGLPLLFFSIYFLFIIYFFLFIFYFLLVYFFCCVIICLCVVALFFLEFMMAAASSVDMLSGQERLIVLRGLAMLAASMKRASKAADNPAISAVYDADVLVVEALLFRFR